MLNTEEDRLLARELDWRSQPGDRRRPPGSNAITAIGIVLTLVQWAITAILLTPFLDRPSGSGVIAPTAIVAFLVYGIEMVIAGAIATRVWIAIGPGARGMLRPIAVLGPWPMLGISFLAVLYVVSFVAAPFLSKTPEPPTSGRNWRLVDTGRRGVTYDEAVELCEQNGERVPNRDDLAAFDPPFPRGRSAWIERPEGEAVLLSVLADGGIAREVNNSAVTPRNNVICFTP